MHKPHRSSEVEGNVDIPAIPEANFLKGPDSIPTLLKVPSIM